MVRKSRRLLDRSLTGGFTACSRHAAVRLPPTVPIRDVIPMPIIPRRSLLIRLFVAVAAVLPTIASAGVLDKRAAESSSDDSSDDDEDGTEKEAPTPIHPDAMQIDSASLSSTHPAQTRHDRPQGNSQCASTPSVRHAPPFTHSSSCRS